MPKYAQDTSVPISRSVAAIQHEVERFGAKDFGFIMRDEVHQVGFCVNGRVYRLDLPMPKESNFRLKTQYEQEKRRRWRVLFMHVKSILVLADESWASFSSVMQPYLVLDGGVTVGQVLDNALPGIKGPGGLMLALTSSEK